MLLILKLMQRLTLALFPHGHEEIVMFGNRSGPGSGPALPVTATQTVTSDTWSLPLPVLAPVVVAIGMGAPDGISLLVPGRPRPVIPSRRQQETCGDTRKQNDE